MLYKVQTSAVCAARTTRRASTKQIRHARAGVSKRVAGHAMMNNSSRARARARVPGSASSQRHVLVHGRLGNILDARTERLETLDLSSRPVCGASFRWNPRHGDILVQPPPPHPSPPPPPPPIPPPPLPPFRACAHATTPESESQVSRSLKGSSADPIDE